MEILTLWLLLAVLTALAAVLLALGTRQPRRAPQARPIDIEDILRAYGADL